LLAIVFLAICMPFIDSSHRTSDFLTKVGLVLPTHMAKGHLHMNLQRPVEVEHILLKNIYAKLEAAGRYRLADCPVTLFGFCPSCQRASSKNGR
jgi:hypothetical protein